MLALVSINADFSVIWHRVVWYITNDISDKPMFSFWKQKNEPQMKPGSDLGKNKNGLGKAKPKMEATDFFETSG